MLDAKAIRGWLASDDVTDQRIVAEYFRRADRYERPVVRRLRIRATPSTGFGLGSCELGAGSGDSPTVKFAQCASRLEPDPKVGILGKWRDDVATRRDSETDEPAQRLPASSAVGVARRGLEKRPERGLLDIDHRVDGFESSSKASTARTEATTGSSTRSMDLREWVTILAVDHRGRIYRAR